MKLEEIQKRQNDLMTCLYELARKEISNSDIDEIACRLKAIYDNDFRHRYMEFYPLVVEVFKSDEYNSDYLGGNLETLRNWVAKDSIENGGSGLKYGNLLDHLNKLADHINLEIGRYSQTAERISRLEDLEKRNTELNDQLSKMVKRVDKLQQKQKDAQKEYITILGIFAAVVLAFTGGIVYSTSIFENIHKASPYRIAFAVLMIGTVLFNLFYFLFSFIKKVIQESSNEEYWLLIIVNGVFVLLLSLLALGWKNGWVENRNSKVYNEPLQHMSIQAEDLNEIGTSVEYDDG